LTALEQATNTRIPMPELVKIINTDKSSFEECIRLAIADKDPTSWRAAWGLSHSTKKEDSRIIPFIDKILSVIPQKKDGHQRELIKLTLKASLNEEQEGVLFDCCMSIWDKVGKSPSVRSLAFSFIYLTIQKYPELKSEIKFLVQEEYLASLSPGVRTGVDKKIKIIFG
jgi:hypothetical protein